MFTASYQVWERFSPPSRRLPRARDRGGAARRWKMRPSLERVQRHAGRRLQQDSRPLRKSTIQEIAAASRFYVAQRYNILIVPSFQRVEWFLGERWLVLGPLHPDHSAVREAERAVSEVRPVPGTPSRIVSFVHFLAELIPNDGPSVARCSQDIIRYLVHEPTSPLTWNHFHSTPLIK